MKDFTSDELAGYAQRALIIRDLVYVTPRDFDTGERADFGFWSGTGDVSFDVVDGLTLGTVARDFTGGGSLLAVGDIPVSDSLSVISTQVSLSPLNTDVESAVRSYDMRYAPVQIYRALFSNANPRALVAPARCRFAGFVNTLQLSTPTVGGSAGAVLNCVGCTNELTRANTQLRSDESQQERHAGDRFFRWVSATGQVQVAWGQSTTT